MKSVGEIEIHVPQARLADLYADPNQNTKWMDDVERMEPISGEPGATNTRLTHEQIYSFKGLSYKVVGFLGRRGIKKGQRRHMEAFKRFAETAR